MSSIPTTLGKYQIIREIARSNDIVYEGYDPLMNRRVAVKELAMPSGSTDTQKEERIKRFHREAKAAGSLTHPNIMTVFDVGEENGRHFIVMEYLDGHTLRNEIDTSGSLKEERAIEVATAILEALDYAHSNGVIHRDIKPENIQILTDGRIKLTDFGIARLTFEPNLTMDGQVFGTPSYMSPEQVVGKDIDARSDLFSAGIVLYEMLAGEKPFQGDSVVSITYAIMNNQPKPLQNINPRIWEVISTVLDKTPSMRYSSAREMIKALTDAKNAPASQNVVVNPTQPPNQQPYQSVYPASAYSSNNPTAGQPAPPPVAYPYNPYSQSPIPPQQMGYPPQGGYQQPGYQPPQPSRPQNQPLPVYHPPPPRTPILKPETKYFLGRLFLAFLLFGTLFVMVILGINWLSRSWQRYQASQQDRYVISPAPAPDKPIDQRIKEERESRAQLKSQNRIQESKAREANLYVERGETQRVAGDDVNAENTFKQALELDATNAAAHASLGLLYSDQADIEQDLDRRLALRKLSANHYVQAAKLETSSRLRASYQESAAVALYTLADYMNEYHYGTRWEARDKLYDALQYAPEKSEIRNRVIMLLQELDR